MAQWLRTQPEMADLVALARALDREEQRDVQDSRARDRQVGETLARRSEEPVTVALTWLDAVENEDESVRTFHQKAETALHLTSFLIAVAALLLGWGATMAAFYFDGSGRVNVVSVVAILVALPAGLIVPFIIAALPSGAVRRVPGATVLGALAHRLSPGRVASLLWRVFPADLRDALAVMSGRATAHQRLYSNVQKWAFLRWSQWFALMFQATALVACFTLVVFTDLAFGWSTTLTTGNAALDAQRVYRITTAAALPWSWALEDARPSLALIEESRYYRVAGASVSRAEAARLGSWWKFVALSIAVYGLLPRAITLAFASARLRAAVRAAIAAEPGLSALTRRIHRAQVETRAVAPETGDASGRTGAVAPAAPSLIGPIQAVVNWSGVPVGAEFLAHEFPGAALFQAGGAAALQDDIALARKLGGARSGDIVVVVKGWEPPLMEFIDFVNTLRESRGAGKMTVVLPFGLGDADVPGPASASQIRLWRDKLTTVGDPWLRVAGTIEEVKS
jgi:hypothetical protein